MNPFRHLKRASKPLFAARKGSVFSLGLRGNLVAAGAGAATLEVDRVRQYPGGRWLDIDPREVELTVPLGADVAPVARSARRLDAAHAEDARRRRGVHAEGERDARGDRRARRASSSSAASHPRRSGRTSAHDGRTLERMAGGLSILMPVFNERSTIEAAIDDALTAELPVDGRELVVVDDGSTDGTRELLALDDLAGRRRRSSSTSGTSARAPPSAPRSGTRPRSSPRSSTPTSSTAPRTSPTCSSRSCRARRTSSSARARGRPSRRSASGT